MSLQHVSSPTPLVGLGARSLDDRSLGDLLGLLPESLLEHVLVVVRAADSEASAPPATVGPFPLIEAASLAARREIPLPLRGVLHLPAGWTIHHDARRWRLVALEEHAGDDEEPIRRATSNAATDDPLDPFFHQIARAAGRRGIGFLASGCGPVGFRGLRRLADAGGLTMVETPQQPGDPPPCSVADHHDCLSSLSRTLQTRLEHLQQGPAQGCEEGGRGNDQQMLSARIEQLERELRTTRADLERKEQALAAADEELKAARERHLARGRVVQRDDQGRPVRMVGIDTNISELKAAERARRQAERWTELAVEAGGLGYWHWEIGTDHVLYSRRERQLLGLPTEGHVTLDDFWQRVHPEDRQRLQQYGREVIASDEPYEAEFRIVHPDGTVRWLAGKGDKTYDEESHRQLLIGMNWDITERRQSEQRLRRLVDTAQVGIAFARADGRIVECNESLLNTLGYDRETFEREGLNWQETNIDIDAMGEFAKSRSICRSSSDDSDTAVVGQFEIPLVRRDGSRVETLCSVRQLEEGGDEFVIFVVDLTPLKTAEEQLRRSEDQLRQAAEGAGFGMYEIDFSTGNITWSPEMRKLLGVATDAEVPARGNLIADFIHPEDRQAADAALGESLNPTGSGLLQHEYRIVRPDGSTRWLLVRGRTAFGGQTERRPLSATGIVLDVTDRKRVEQSLLRAQAEAEAASRSKSEFLANMSHEIRTPMTAILGYADLVAEQLSNPVALEQVETIRRNGRFLLNIINDILDLSKIDAGRLEVHRQPCQVGQLITDVCALMEVRVREKGLQLIVDFEGQIPQTIDTDPTRLRQVLVNLIGNAIKFTDEGSVEVVVRHDEAEQRLQIDVVDTGIGIAEDVQSELFAPFMQGDTAINRQFGGTGLGLAITRRLAEMLGGEVGVTSTLGEGSCFTVSMATGPLDGVPRVSPVLQIPNTPPPEKNSSRVNSRILVVDDSRDIRALASTLLKRAGAEVATVEGGQEAIDAVVLAEAEGRPFELIFMDVQMPGMDGPAAVSRLRASGYSIPIVALTANAMQGDREKCLRQGYTDYLSKPLDIRHFSATLKKYLHH